jgi:hypothetical protein
MSRWLIRHWRDLALIVLLFALGAAWNDALRDARLEGILTRCTLVPW